MLILNKREPGLTVSDPLRELVIQQFADTMLKNTGNTLAARNTTEVLRQWKPIFDLTQPERRAAILRQLDENGGTFRKLLKQAAEALVAGPIPAPALDAAVERLADAINTSRISAAPFPRFATPSNRCVTSRSFSKSSPNLCCMARDRNMRNTDA